jgi:hypothetical protein
MTLSSTSRVFISNPSAIRAQQLYALLSPKLCNHSDPQKTQHLDFLTGYLRLVRHLVHHLVHLELKGQDVMLLRLRNFYTAFSPGGRPVSLRLSSLALNFCNGKFLCWLRVTAHNIGGRSRAISILPRVSTSRRL